MKISSDRRLLIALIGAGGAALFAVLRLWPAVRGGTAEAPRIIDGDAESALARETGFDVPGAGRRSQEGTRQRIRTAFEASGVPAASMAGLVDMASERIMILGTGDFGAYAAAVQRAGGRDVRADTNVRSEFESLDRSFENAKVSIDGIQVRARTLNGKPAWDQPGGRLTTTNSFVRYAGSDAAGWKPEEVWDVVIPIAFETYRGFDGEARFFLIHSYARRKDGSWVPFRSELYDPTGRSPSLPPPWM